MVSWGLLEVRGTLLSPGGGRGVVGGSYNRVGTSGPPRDRPGRAEILHLLLKRACEAVYNAIHDIFWAILMLMCIF